MSIKAEAKRLGQDCMVGISLAINQAYAAKVSWRGWKLCVNVMCADTYSRCTDLGAAIVLLCCTCHILLAVSLLYVTNLSSH